MKPKRTQIRSRLCGRVKRVTTPAAVAWSRTAATSCAATSRGSVSMTTTGPWSIIAGPLRSPTAAPTSRSPPSTAPHENTMSAVAGQGTAANSKSGLAIAASGRGRYPIPCQTRGTVADAREGTGTAAGGWLPARLPVLLLGAKHGVLQSLRETELADALRRNLDRLAGLWITAHPRLAIREDQLPEPRQQEHAALLGFLGREVERLVEDAFDLFPGEAGLLRKVRNRRGLRHRLRHR